MLYIDWWGVLQLSLTEHEGALQGVRAKNRGICSQTMLGAAKLRRSSRCGTPQRVKTAHPGHNTSLTLSDCRRVAFLEHLVFMYFSGGRKNWREDTTHCVGLDQQQAQGVYEHRGIRHHCWRACWQLSSPLHPESSINLHNYFVRNQKGGAVEVMIS